MKMSERGGGSFPGIQRSATIVSEPSSSFREGSKKEGVWGGARGGGSKEKTNINGRQCLTLA